MLWAAEVDMQLSSYSRFHIDMKVKEGVSHDWFLTGFYGESRVAAREEGWGVLRSLNQNRNDGWLVIGYFNEILLDNEQSSRNQRPPIKFKDFVRLWRTVTFMIWVMLGVNLPGAIVGRMSLLSNVVWIGLLPMIFGRVSVLIIKYFIFRLDHQIIVLCWLILIIPTTFPTMAKEGSLLDLSRCGLTIQISESSSIKDGVTQSLTL